MPLFIKHLLFTVFVSYSYSAIAIFKECENSLKLSSTSEWYPYIYQDENNISTGVDVELLTIILNRMGCKLEVIHFPERRALFELKQGRFDIALGASKNANRTKDFFYSKPYRNEINKFAYRVNEQDIAAAKNLQEILKMNKAIAINYAGWYGSEIEKAKKEYKSFSYSPTAANRLKMLSLGRVDLVIDDEIALRSELQRHKYQDINIHPMVLFETSIHFIFNKASISLLFIERFNEVLKNMKNDVSLTENFYKKIPTQSKVETNNKL